PGDAPQEEDAVAAGYQPETGGDFVPTRPPVELPRLVAGVFEVLGRLEGHRFILGVFGVFPRLAAHGFIPPAGAKRGMGRRTKWARRGRRAAEGVAARTTSEWARRELMKP